MTPPYPAFDNDAFAAIGLPVSALFRAISGLRPQLVGGEGVTAALVDAAFIQAHIIALADLLADPTVDADRDAAAVDEVAFKLRETIAIQRLLR